MILQKDIIKAYDRIKPIINKTPVIQSQELNHFLGHEIYFKAESLQITGAFKVRGVLNAVLSLKENNQLPAKLVAYSSGNHARAVAWAGKNIANVPSEIYMHKSASLSKQDAIRALGADLIITEMRKEAEEKAKAIGNTAGNYFLHPSDNDLVIAGAATLTYEALQQLDFVPDAIFAACGGGALLSGAYLGALAAEVSTKIYAGEPAIANDAAISYQLKKIVGFEDSPQTIADGLRTLKVSERTFKYLQQLSGFIEANEAEILYWTIWLNKLLDVPCEPTSALTMAAAVKWLGEQQSSAKKILILLSGGNIDAEIIELLKTSHYLNHPPSFNFFAQLI